MKNVFDLLKPGGDILTKFPRSHPMCDVYEKMVKIEKWKKYKKELEFGILAYQFQKNIETSLRELLTETGFEILMCKCEDYTYVFESLEELESRYSSYNVKKYLTKIILLVLIILKRLYKFGSLENEISVMQLFYIITK